MDKVWQKEKRRRDAEQWRKDRMRRNWPIHRQIAVRVLNQFKDAARGDGVTFVVDGGQHQQNLKRLREFPGQEEIKLVIPSFAYRKEIDRSHGTESVRWDVEHGGGLIIQYLEWRGIVQAWCILPWIGKADARDSQDKDILLFYSYNPDDITEQRVAKMISQTLTIHRVATGLSRASWWDVQTTRYWKYMDDRNRKGIGGRNFKLIGPWFITVTGAFYLIVTLASAVMGFF